MQVPHCVHTEVQEEKTVWTDKAGAGGAHDDRPRPPAKHSVSQVVGYIKGKSAIWIARVYGERQRYFSGQHMWARGYFVSTVGLDEEVIREYIKNQEDDDRRQDELFD